MLAVVLAAALAATPPQRADLLGLWESVKTDNGIGVTLEFRADATYVQATAVMVDRRYRVVGDRLLVAETPPGEGADTAGAPRIRFDGGAMLVTGPDGIVVRKERVGSAQPDAPPIVGAWRFRHSSGGTAFERYAPDGTVSFRLPMSSTVGIFVLNQRELTTLPPGRTAEKATVEIADGRLIVSGPGGRKTTYRRAAAGAWYDREHVDYRPPE